MKQGQFEDLDEQAKSEAPSYVVTHSHAVVRMMATGLLSLPPQRENEPGVKQSVLTPINRDDVQKVVRNLKTKKMHLPVVIELQRWSDRPKMSSLPFSHVKRVLVESKSEMGSAFAEIIDDIDSGVIELNESPDLFPCSHEEKSSEAATGEQSFAGEIWEGDEIENIERAGCIGLVLKATRMAINEMGPHGPSDSKLCELFHSINKSCNAIPETSDPITSLVSSLAGISDDLCPISKAMRKWRDKIVRSTESSPQAIFALFEDCRPKLDDDLDGRIETAFKISRGESSVEPARLLDAECNDLNTVRAIILIATGNGHSLKNLFKFFELPEDQRPGKEVLLRAITIVACFSNSISPGIEDEPNQPPQTRKILLADTSLRSAHVYANLAEEIAEANTLLELIPSLEVIPATDLVQLKIVPPIALKDIYQSHTLIQWSTLSQCEQAERDHICSLLKTFKEVVVRFKSQELFTDYSMQDTYPGELSIKLNVSSHTDIFLKVNATTSHYKLHCDIAFRKKKPEAIDSLLEFLPNSKCACHFLWKEDGGNKTKRNLPIGIRFHQDFPAGTVDDNEAEHWIKSFHATVIAATKVFTEG